MWAVCDCLMGWRVRRLIPGGDEIFCTNQSRLSGTGAQWVLNLSWS